MVAFRCTFHGPTAAAAAHVDESLEPYVSLLAAREVEFMSGERVPPEQALKRQGVRHGDRGSDTGGDPGQPTGPWDSAQDSPRHPNGFRSTGRRGPRTLWV